jgi:hypothetical protein
MQILHKGLKTAALAIALLGLGWTTLGIPAEASDDNGHRRNGGAWWKNGRPHPGRTYYYPAYPATPYYYYPGATYSALPSGCRRVYVRNRPYYTRDNKTFFTYLPTRRLYMVVNPLSWF